MADWKTFSQVQKYPRVLRRFKTVARRFKTAVETEARGSAVWARRKPGLQAGISGDHGYEVDIEAVPGIPAMRNGGILG